MQADHITIQRAEWLETCLRAVPPERLNHDPDRKYPGWATGRWQAPTGAGFRYQPIPKSGSTSIRSFMTDSGLYPAFAAAGAGWEYADTTQNFVFQTTTAQVYCGLFGFTFVAEPLNHFINGYIQTHFGQPAYCTPQQFEIYGRWYARRPRAGAKLDVHEAPAMSLLREVYEHFTWVVGPGGSGAAHCRPWGFIGHMTSQSATEEWAALTWIMRRAGVRVPIEGELPYNQARNQLCKMNMGYWKKAGNLPEGLATVLCEDLLEDYACLGFALPPPCASLRPRLEKMKSVIAQYHGREPPPFEEYALGGTEDHG